MLFAGWEVRIVKNCDRGFENASRGRSNFMSEVTVFHYLFIFFPSSQTKKTHRKKTHASVSVTVVRERKIRTALRTNQIAGFVTVPAWEKNKSIYFHIFSYIYDIGGLSGYRVWLFYGISVFIFFYLKIKKCVTLVIFSLQYITSQIVMTACLLKDSGLSNVPYNRVKVSKETEHSIRSDEVLTLETSAL